MPRRNHEALDAALDERNRLVRNYKRAKRRDLQELFSCPENGINLKNFITRLNKFGIDDGDAMIEYVVTECGRWISQATEKFHYAVIEAIDNRCITIREQAGMPPFHDPMPWEEDSVFFVCKREIRR